MTSRPTDPPGSPPSLPRSGLCATCGHAEVLRSKRSAFLRCRLADRDPRFPRYPPLPVLACAGFEPAPENGDRGPR